MTVTYLKKADKTPQTGTNETQAIVSEMLSRIEDEVKMQSALMLKSWIILLVM